MKTTEPLGRRPFVKRVLAAGAALSGWKALTPPTEARASQEPGVGALDHVAIPIQNVDAMAAFYRGLGFRIMETGSRISIHFGDQKMHFHRPSTWQNPSFTLRARAAQPPCGDFCWVWEGTDDALRGLIERVGAEIEAEGERVGGRDGGTATGYSVYIRDPDGNLLEFIRYA